MRERDAGSGLGAGAAPDRARAGLSLLEVVIIAVILAVVGVPLMQGFGTFTRGMHRTTRQTAAVYVGQAVMEQIKSRVALSSGPEIDFSDLAEAGARVATQNDGERSKYFVRFENLQGTQLHGITRETDPELFLQLSRFACDVVVDTASASGYLDSDGNGANEKDMAEIGVTVKWEAPGGSMRETSLYTLVTGLRAGSRE